MTQSTTMRRFAQKMVDIGVIGISEQGRVGVARTYAGRHQRSNGAWSFELTLDGLPTSIGSYYPMTQLANSREIVKYAGRFDLSLYPIEVIEEFATSSDSRPADA